MPRTRLIKPEFFQSDELARVSFGARLLFAGLWTIADREGRLEDRPLRIKAQVFPLDEVEIEPLLDELRQEGLIRRYESDGVHCICIPTFSKHQKIHPREAESELPPYPGEPEANLGAAEPYLGNEKEHVMRVVSTSDSVSTSTSDSEPAALGAAAAKQVTESLLESLAERHPNLNVHDQLERYRDWKRTNGKKHRDEAAGFRNWLKKAEDMNRDRPPPSKNGNGKGRNQAYIRPPDRVVT